MMASMQPRVNTNHASAWHHEAQSVGLLAPRWSAPQCSAFITNTSLVPRVQRPYFATHRLAATAGAAPSLPLGAPTEDEQQWQPGQQPDLPRFVSWLVSKGVKGVGQTDSKVQLVQLGPTERGVVCCQPIARGEVIFRIPFELLVTDQPTDAADATMYKGAAGSIRLAARLLRERARGPQSPWWPYITTLPQQVNCMVQLLKDPLDISALEYPAMSSTLRSYRQLLRQAYDKCTSESLAGASYEEFEWAMTIINSRCLEADGWELMMWAGPQAQAGLQQPPEQPPPRKDQQAQASAQASDYPSAAPQAPAAGPDSQLPALEQAEAAAPPGTPGIARVANGPCLGASQTDESEDKDLSTSTSSGSPEPEAVPAHTSGIGIDTAADRLHSLPSSVLHEPKHTSDARPDVPDAVTGLDSMRLPDPLSSDTMPPDDPLQSISGASCYDSSVGLDNLWWASDYIGMLVKVANSRMISASLSGAAGGTGPAGRHILLLAPLLDMLNHAPARETGRGRMEGQGNQQQEYANVRWHLQQPAAKQGFGGGSGGGKKKRAAKDAGGAAAGVTGWELQAVATEAVSPGQDLLLCYKPGEGNDSFGLHYGFLPGHPPGENPDDDVLLFEKGLQQALEWHCQVYAVQEPALLPVLHCLDNGQLLSLYQAAYDAGAASLSMDSMATDAPIKMGPGGVPPAVLMEAFSATIQAAQAASDQAVHNSDTSNAPGAVQPIAQQQSPAGPGQGLRPQQGGGMGGLGPKEHAVSAVARLCISLLHPLTPLLHDLETLSSLASNTQQQQEVHSSDNSGAESSQPGNTSSVEQYSAVVASAGGDRPLRDAVAWAQVLHSVQGQVEHAAEQLISLPPITSETPSATTVPDGSQSGGAGAGSNTNRASEDGLAAAVHLMQLAGCGPSVGASHNGASNDAGRTEAQAAVAGQGAGGCAPPSAAQLLALHYRVNKKRILWDVLLKSSPQALRAAFAT